MTNKKDNTDSQGQLWEVFTQGRKGKPFEHAGNVHASDAEKALENARDVYTRRKEAVNLWVVPSKEIVASQPEDQEPFLIRPRTNPTGTRSFITLPEPRKSVHE